MARGGQRSGTPGQGHSVEAGAEPRDARRDLATSWGMLCVLPSLVGFPQGRTRLWDRGEGTCWSWLCYRSPRGQGYWSMLGTRALWVGSAKDPLDCEDRKNWTAWPKRSPVPQSQHSVHGELEMAVKGRVTGSSLFRPHVEKKGAGDRQAAGVGWACGDSVPVPGDSCQGRAWRRGGHRAGERGWRLESPSWEEGRGGADPI